VKAALIFHSKGETDMSTLKKSLLTLGAIAAIGGLVAATPLPALAQTANPCAPNASSTSAPKAKAANPCAPKAKTANPCAPKAKAANPCAPKK
jgi:hypothetical protein